MSRDAVVLAARSWLRTPYHHHAQIKGVGVDCANLLCGVFYEAGLTPHIDPGHYAHDWHLHHSEEMFIDWLIKSGANPVEFPQAGDIAVFRYGRTFSHGAIMLDAETTIHAYINMGVIITRLNEEPLAGRVAQYWSLF